MSKPNANATPNLTHLKALAAAHAHLAAIVADLRLQVLEQATPIDLIACAWISREHVALVGPQGEAKTMLADRFSQYTTAATFSRLLTRFSTPDEVLGHFSLAKLQQDLYERRVQGMAPEAGLVVLDEIFKANSPMLNSLLGMMNERRVDGLACKLDTLIGLSNEWPRGIDSLAREGDDDSLLPLWDRFVYRYEVKRPQGDDTFMAVLCGVLPDAAEAPMTDAEVATLRAEVARVHAGLAAQPAMLAAFKDIRRELLAKGVQISSRRWNKAGRAVAAHAVLNGRCAVAHSDLRVLEHVLWNTPAERDAVREVILASGNPDDAHALTVEAEVASLINSATALTGTDLMAKLPGMVKAINAHKADLDALMAGAEDATELRRVATWLNAQANALSSRLLDALR